MDLRDDLVRHYQWLRQYGYNDSHSGNISGREAEQFWITPTGACADLLAANELVRCPLDGPPTVGASLDADLHRLTYLACPEAVAVIHSHGPYTVALTMDGEDFLPPDFEGQYYFDRIPVLTIPYDRYVAEAPAQVAAALADRPVVVVRGHGVYARGTTLNLAYKWTCSVESSARTTLLARLAGTL